jgi:hypothetical protein
VEAPEKQVRIEQLRTESKAMLEELVRQGFGDIGLGFVRFEMFIEAAMPWDDGNNEARVDFELRWEEHANKVLNQVMGQVNKAKLLQGVGLAPPNGV